MQHLIQQCWDAGAITKCNRNDVPEVLNILGSKQHGDLLMVVNLFLHGCEFSACILVLGEYLKQKFLENSNYSLSK
jgi:hypothetical protein